MADLAGIQPIAKANTQKFYSPTEGLSIKTPSVVGEYQGYNFETDAYDPDYNSFFDKLMNDTAGRYTGAVPAIGQGAKKWKTQQEKPATAGNKIAGVLSSPAIGQVVGGLDSLSQSMGNMNRNEYESDLTYWKEQGKWWFDPDADTRPDLEAYMNQMPSSLESRTAGSEVMGIATQTASGASTGAQMGGGWGALIGAGVGGLIGTFQTIFGRKSAREEDEKNDARARAMYEKALKEWTVKRLKRQAAQKEQRYEGQKAEREIKLEKDKNDNVYKAQSAGRRRQQIAQAIMSAGSAKSAHMQKRMERWS